MRRGGAGVSYEAEVIGQVIHTFRSEGLGHSAGFGVNGAGDGDNCKIMVTEHDGSHPELPLYGKLTLKNPRFEMLSGGGGGFGNPLQRPIDAVVTDVMGGIVSSKAAEEFYGVIVTNEGVVDEAQTTAARNRAKG